MNVEKIKLQYPKAYDELGKYIMMFVKKQGANEETLNSFPVDVAIKMAFSNSQAIRSLFDFFDGYQMYMTISFKDNYWHVYINDVIVISDDSKQFDFTHKTRVKAEEIGFEQCFNLLEQKLSL